MATELSNYVLYVGIIHIIEYSPKVFTYRLELFPSFLFLMLTGGLQYPVSPKSTTSNPFNRNGQDWYWIKNCFTKSHRLSIEWIVDYIFVFRESALDLDLYICWVVFCMLRDTTQEVSLAQSWKFLQSKFNNCAILLIIVNLAGYFFVSVL